MKKIIFILTLVVSFPFKVNSQETENNIKFDTKYFDAVDHYVTFPKKDKDSTYGLYFIYIDKMAGFSMKYENDFIINKNKKLQLIPNEALQNTSITTRLERNTKSVAILSKAQTTQLGLPKLPEWLKYYKPTKTVDVNYLTKIGYHYNHIGASHNAIEPLLKAYTEKPHYKGLEFELGFAYNATKQFKKAVPILENAIKKDTKNELLYKELGYAFVNDKKIDKAEKVYKKGISVSKDIAIKCEMAVNMAQLLFIEKDKKKFNKWAKIARKYGDKTPQFIKYIDYFEDELKKSK